ncbi:MAG: chemotaxis protein CheA [Spirochaetes bacterium]|jgi:two-component system chemotaxis sensor kinase CheA|nr:chemotaxis protein CheA [Spirochaetota bacterium]
MSDRFRDSFKEEAYELLNDLEGELLELEENPTSEEQISCIFRSMHNIKGSAAMFGFQHISDFAHSIENRLDEVREGRLAVTQELIDVILKSRDHIRMLLEEDEPPPDELQEVSARLVDEVKSIGAPSSDQGMTVVPESPESLTDIGAEEASEPATSGEGEETLDHRVTYRVEFRPKADIYLSGSRPLLLLQELSELGEYSAVAYPDRIPPLDELDPEQCLLSWDAFVTTDRPQNALEDVFLFVQDTAEVHISVADEFADEDDAPSPRIGEILRQRGVADDIVIEEAAQGQRRLGELLVEKGVDPHAVEGALKEQQHVSKARERAHEDLSSSSIRVNASKLDDLVDLVGELVTLQARLSQTAGELKNTDVTSVAEGVERLTNELRDSTMSIRMVPIGTTFSRFRRVVRDLGQELGKEVEMVTSGGETELDKTVIERLNEPLVHIIRNSIDHGVEDPDERERSGKLRKGTLTLSAEHVGASVVIRVSDDGKGFDKGNIMRLARERGVIDQSTDLSEQEAYNLVFQAGFTTVDSVTSVSGRGVGMDVVKREIEGFGGTVAIESTAGEGSAVVLTIPLTLAIIDGLLVEVAGDSYVFPLSAVEECIELTADQATGNGSQDIINNRGEVLPYVRLREIFDFETSTRNIEQVVVVGSSTGKVGFVVDDIIGDFQTVIKNLGKLYRDIEGISGATILGDGSVAFILDIQRLSEMIARSQHAIAG